MRYSHSAFFDMPSLYNTRNMVRYKKRNFKIKGQKYYLFEEWAYCVKDPDPEKARWKAQKLVTFYPAYHSPENSLKIGVGRTDDFTDLHEPVFKASHLFQPRLLALEFYFPDNNVYRCLMPCSS